MNFRKLLTDDSAVSPVIGVILMVAITVILAAVIAAFVLGLGDTDEVAPQVTFNYDYDSGEEELTIAVSSGDAFTAERVTFRGEGLNGNDRTAWDEQSAEFGPTSTIGSGDRVTLGDGVESGVTGTGDAIESDFRLEVVWTSQDGDDSSVLSTRNGPDRER